MAATTLVIVGCTPGSSSDKNASATSQTTSIVTAWPADITNVNPVQGANPQDNEVVYNTYQGLVGYTFKKVDDGSWVQQGSKLAPVLAKSWKVDKTSVTFHLDPNRVFYPSGNPVRAEDVKWSLGQALQSPNAQDIFTNGLQGEKDIKIVDEHTVTINFKDQAGKPVEVSPTTLAMFANGNMSIVDSVEATKHATAKDRWGADWLRENTAGTGPYYIKSHTPGQELVLQAVPKHPTPPAFTTVTARIVNDANVGSLLKGGEINLAEFNLSQTDVNTLKAAGFTVASQPAPMLTYLTMGADKGPFADARVRQAVAYAIPYDQIVNSVYFGRASRALSYVNPTSSAYTKAWGTYHTDLGAASTLMAKAGHPSITVPLHYSSADPAQEDIAILLQENLKRIGITVTLTPHTAAEQWDVINGRSRATSHPGSPDMVLFNWGPWTDDPKIPVGFASTTGGVNNYALWSNPTVDKINATWEARAASTERDAAYKQAQQIVAEAAPLIPITYAERQTVLAPGITGASFQQFAGTRFYLLERAH
ncbi:MAG: ABC transporter substrate-binding protein [Acidipropionibacterium sp.]|nr:ABC transporter substrate-binding protein [Acidipropionibacterium sp.]